MLRSRCPSRPITCSASCPSVLGCSEDGDGLGRAPGRRPGLVLAPSTYYRTLRCHLTAAIGPRILRPWMAGCRSGRRPTPRAAGAYRCRQPKPTSSPGYATSVLVKSVRPSGWACNGPHDRLAPWATVWARPPALPPRAADPRGRSWSSNDLSRVARPRGAPTLVQRASGFWVTRSYEVRAGSVRCRKGGGTRPGFASWGGPPRRRRREGPEPGDDACERAYRRCFTFCSLWRGSEVPQPALLRPLPRWSVMPKGRAGRRNRGLEGYAGAPGDPCPPELPTPRGVLVVG